MTSNNPDNGFVEWLLAQIDERRWTAAILAEQARVAPASISNVINRKRAAGPELLKALADALHVSQVEMFSRAGLIDEKQYDDDEAAREYMRLLAAIEGDDERQEAIDVVETILRRISSRRKESPAPGRRRASRYKGAT